MSNSAPVDLAGSTRCSTFLTGPTLAPGGTQQVDVGLTFSDVDGQTAQHSQARIDLVVTLSQVGHQGDVNICGEQAEAEPTCATQHQSSVALLGTSRSSGGLPASCRSPGNGASGNRRTRNLEGMLVISVAMILLGSLFVVLKRDRRGANAPRHRAS